MNSTVIGFILGRIEYKQSNPKPIGYIAMLVVDPQYRRMGLGKQLVERFISSSVQANVSKIYLETEACNIISLSLYEQLGFVAVKFLPKYYWNGNDAYRLKLYLDLPRVQISK
jgi:peptide alpha-N-acetyltransferase